MLRAHCFHKVHLLLLVLCSALASNRYALADLIEFDIEEYDDDYTSGVIFQNSDSVGDNFVQGALTTKKGDLSNYPLLPKLCQHLDKKKSLSNILTKTSPRCRPIGGGMLQMLGVAGLGVNCRERAVHQLRERAVRQLSRAWTVIRGLLRSG